MDGNKHFQEIENYNYINVLWTGFNWLRVEASSGLF